MSILYRPVLIETVEQAEALPVGTVATHSSGAGMDHAHKVGLGDHLAHGWLSLSADVDDAAMVGWTALVPVEAEEEARWRDAGPIRSLNDPRRKPYPEGGRLVQESRFVTPWEEA